MTRLLTFVLLLVTATSFAAPVPSLMNYQGKLTNAVNLPLNDTFSLTFSIYADSSSGLPLWTETQRGVRVTSGLFNVVLGSYNPVPDSVFATENRWLGIRIRDDAELTSRRRFVAVAYAFRAKYADSAKHAIKADTATYAYRSDTSNYSFRSDTSNYSYNSKRADTATFVIQSDTVWRVSGGNAYRLNGSVGLGTANPAGRLHVLGSTYVGNNSGDANSFRISLGGSGGSYGSVGYGFLFTDTADIYHYAVDDFSSQINFREGGFDFLTAPSGTSGNAVNYLTAMRMERGGNLGIGTLTPDSRLQVEGQAQVNDGALWPDTRSYASFGVTRPPTGENLSYLGMTKFQVFPWGIGVASNDAFIVGQATVGRTIPSPYFSIARITGNVGVGTTNPAYKLDVAGDVRTSGTLYGNADVWDGHHWGDTYPTASNSDMLDSHHWGETYPYSSNSDLVDGIHGSQFLRNDQSGTLNGSLTVTNAVTIGGSYAGTAAAIRNTSSTEPTVWISNNSSGEALACGNQVSGATYVVHIIGFNNLSSSYGLLVRGQSRIEGNLNVVGTLTKSSGSFKIDHPLDPENKYLYHSFVESPDMKDVYDGIAVLDDNGRAVVELPDYFRALNKDYRYQLTCIGGFAPVYVAEELVGNRFLIAGGKRGLKVSWQVTGIRQDAYANLHRIPVEEDKAAADRGKYLHPEAFGKSTADQIGSQSAPARAEKEGGE